jgi:uncharacterized protein YwqG
MTSKLSAENETLLRQKIAEQGWSNLADSVVELIVENVTECVALALDGPEDYTRTGNSRYGGVPDLPPDLEWPRSARGNRFEFLVQIALSEVPQPVGSVLPDRGILYCFVEEYESLAEGVCHILYSDADPATLKRCPIPESEEEREQEGFGLYESYYGTNKPHKLKAQVALDLADWYSPGYEAIIEAIEADLGDQYADQEEQYGDFVRELRRPEGQSIPVTLLGQPCWIGYIADWYVEAQESEGEQAPALLLRLDSSREVNTSFGDAGYLQFYVPRDALARHDFSRAILELESS